MLKFNISFHSLLFSSSTILSACSLHSFILENQWDSSKIFYVCSLLWSVLSFLIWQTQVLHLFSSRTFCINNRTVHPPVFPACNPQSLHKSTRFTLSHLQQLVYSNSGIWLCSVISFEGGKAAWSLHFKVSEKQNRNKKAFFRNISFQPNVTEGPGCERLPTPPASFWCSLMTWDCHGDSESSAHTADLPCPSHRVSSLPTHVLFIKFAGIWSSKANILQSVPLLKFNY